MRSPTRAYARSSIVVRASSRRSLRTFATLSARTGSRESSANRVVGARRAQQRVFDDHRVRRAAAVVEQALLAEEVARPQQRYGDFFAVGGFADDPHAAALDEIDIPDAVSL